MIYPFEESFLKLTPNVQVIYRKITAEELFFILKVESNQATCPSCSNTSQRAHSRYTRKISDLPAGGISVHLQLITRKWFCDHEPCSVKVFSERLNWMHPYARTTNRLEEVVRKVGFSTNCLTAEKVCHSLGISISHDSILRRIKKPINQPTGVSPFRRYR